MLLVTTTPPPSVEGLITVVVSPLGMLSVTVTTGVPVVPKVVSLSVDVTMSQVLVVGSVIRGVVPVTCGVTVVTI